MKLNIHQIRDITCGAVRVEEKKDGFRFYRFTKEQESLYEKLRQKDLYIKTFATSGICFRFKTDSKTFAFRGVSSKGSTRSYFSFELFVNGKKAGGVDNFVPAPYTQGNPKTDFPLGDFSAEFELPGGEKEICLYFPWSATVVLNEVALSDGASITPTGFSKKLLVFGDSITQGYDALYPSNKYVTRLAEYLGAEEINKAIGKEVYFPELSATREAFDPDYIVVAYGSNDWNYSTKEEFLYNCRTFYDNLKKNYPRVPTFIITPIWRKDQTKDRPLGSMESVAAFLEDMAKEEGNRYIIHGAELVPSNEDLFADLRLHPNDKGFDIYFNNLLRQLKAYGAE